MATGEINKYNFLRWKKSVQMVEQLSTGDWSTVFTEVPNAVPLTNFDLYPRVAGMFADIDNNRLSLEIFSAPPYNDSINRRHGLILKNKLEVGKRYRLTCYVDESQSPALPLLLDPVYTMDPYSNSTPGYTYADVLNGKRRYTFTATSEDLSIYMILELPEGQYIDYQRIFIWNITFEEEAIVHTGIYIPLVPEIELNVTPIEDDEDVLPRIYNKTNDCSLPILVPAESTSFYINRQFELPEGYKLCLTQGYLIKADNIATINALSLKDGFNYYCELTNPNVPDGIYQLAFCVGNVKVLESNPIKVTRDITKSSVVKFRHDNQIMGFCYDFLPDFYQQFRLMITQKDMQFESSIEQYRSVTTGLRRNYKEKTDKYYKFETYYFDRYAHEACGLMLEHSDLLINTKNFPFKEGYKINTNELTNTYKGEFERYEEKFVIDKQSRIELYTLYSNFENGDLSSEHLFPSFSTYGGIISGEGAGYCHTNEFKVSVGDILKIEFDLEIIANGILIGVYDSIGGLGIVFSGSEVPDGANSLSIPIIRTSETASVMIGTFMGVSANFNIENFRIFIV
jgi:hypothetical protein